MTEASSPTARSGAARTLGVLERIAQNAPEPSTVTALARDLGLSKAVVHRILQELVGADFVAYDAESRRYQLGSNALLVGMAALRSLDVPQLARPFLVDLVRETGETATLSMRQGWTRIYVDQVASPQEIRMTVALGTAHALHAGSSSKAILAALDEGEVERYLAEADLAAVTDSTITDPPALLVELERIRTEGFAISLSERQPGAASVAAAVRTADTSPWGSISVCGPRDRITRAAHRRHAALVVAAARELSAACGHLATSPEADT